MPTWTIETRALAQLFAQLRKFGRGPRGDAGWVFDDETLEIEWAGVALGVPAQGTEQGSVRVDAKTMSAIVRAPLPKIDTLAIAVENDTLSLGTFSVPCQVRERPVPQLLPMAARPLDVALLPYRHTAGEITDAGLEDRIADVQRREARAVAAAAEALAWLGVQEKHVVAWLEEHLSKLAGVRPATAPRQVVIDRAGQVQLFDEA